MVDPKHPIVVEAIENKLQVSFRYHSENSLEETATERTVEPWIYGCKNGKESLYGFQVGGENPGMRRYDMRRVKKVLLTGDHMENHPTDVADITKWDNIWAAMPTGNINLQALENPADKIAA